MTDVGDVTRGGTLTPGPSPNGRGEKTAPIPDSRVPVAPLKDRNDLLLQWAAEVRRGERLKSIVDFGVSPWFIGIVAGKNVALTCADLGASPEIIARQWAHYAGQVCDGLAAWFRLQAQERHGVVEAEFAQALRDYDCLCADGQPAQGEAG